MIFITTPISSLTFFSSFDTLQNTSIYKHSWYMNSPFLPELLNK